jgi:hypothetical protein
MPDYNGKPGTPNLNKALAAFQSGLPKIRKGEEGRVSGTTKDGKPYSYTYKYADLSDISPMVLTLLGAHGLSWVTRPTMINGAFGLAYELRHESGEMLDGVYPLHYDTLGPQDLGKEITYARRYALCAVTGIAPGDDDDDAASAQQAQARQARQLPPQAQRGKERAQRRAQEPTPAHEGLPEERTFGPNDPRTIQQSNRIFAMLGELGLEYKSEEGKAEVLALFGGWLEKPLESTRDLTIWEANTVIDHLQIMIDTESRVDSATGEVQ